MTHRVDQPQTGRNLLSRFKRARRFVRWYPLVTATLMVVLHFIIELHYVSYVPYPHDMGPAWLTGSFLILFWSTLLLALFIFPRWQSLPALLSLAFVVLSVGGR